MAKKTRDILFLIFFMAIVGYALSTFFAALALSKGAIFDNMFFRHGEDHFMDFFNSIRDNREVTAMWDHWTVYPPVVAVVFMWLSNFIPEKYLSRDPNVHYLIQYSAAAIALYFIFCLVSFAILIYAGNKLLKGKGALTKVVAFLAVGLCYPLLWSVERGQVLTLSISLMVYFLAFSDSKTPWKRETSYIALALSGVIKVYPLMFILVLVRKRDWWGFLKTCIYSLLVMMVPFIFYRGTAGLIVWLRNLFYFADGRGNFTGLDSLGVPLWALLLAGVALFVLVISQKRDWETYLLTAGLMFIIFKNRVTYSFCYYIPMLFLLLKEEKDGGSYVALFISALVLYIFWKIEDGAPVHRYKEIVEAAFTASVLLTSMQFVTRLVWIDLPKENIWSRDYRRSIFRPRLPTFR